MKAKKRILAAVLMLMLVQTLVLPVCLPSASFLSSSASAAAKLKISKSKATMYIGTTLNLTVKGAKKVKWKSSNKKIATVSSKGVVKAKAEGSATITATAGGKKYKCKITVKSAYGISVDTTNLKIWEGDEEELIISSPYSKKIKVKCSNQVVSCEWYWKTKYSGWLTIKAVAPGTETIVLSNSKSSEKLKITVTVEKKPYYVRIKENIDGKEDYELVLDVNRDGKINNMDYVIAKKIDIAYRNSNQTPYGERVKEYVNSDPSERTYDEQLDINKDGIINNMDYVIIHKIEVRMY